MIDEIATLAELHEGTALPMAHVVHSDPDAPETVEEQPLPDSVSCRPVSQKSPAEWAYERLVLYLRNFEEQLDRDQELALGYAGGEAGVLRIEGVGYFDPDIITFYGRDDDGRRMQIIQHVTQLNVALIAVPKDAPVEEPARRIGFQLVRDLEEGGRTVPSRRKRVRKGNTPPPAEEATPGPDGAKPRDRRE